MTAQQVVRTAPVSPIQDFPVIAVMSRKGGSGKTTLSKILASAAKAAGHSVLMVDVDPSRNLEGWRNRAAEAGAEMSGLDVQVPDDVEGISELLDAAYDRRSHDLAIVDTAGVGMGASERIAILADVVLVPSRLSETDLDTTLQTLSWFEGLRERTDDPSLLPELRVVVNGLQAKPSKAEKRALAAMVQRMPLAEVIVQHRQAYIDMDAEGPLGHIAEERGRSRNPLLRGHRARFAEAMEEAALLYRNLVGDIEHRRAA